MKTLRKKLMKADRLVQKGKIDKAVAVIRPAVGKIIRIAERQELKGLVGMMKNALEKEQSCTF